MDYDEIHIIPPEDGDVFDIVAHVRNQNEPIRLTATGVEIAGMDIIDIDSSFTISARHKTRIETRTGYAAGDPEREGSIVNITVETDDSPTFTVEQI